MADSARDKRAIEDFLKDFTFIGAEDYIALRPGAGSVHRSGLFDIPYYTVRNCLCAGELGQVVLPLPGRDERQYVLNESFNYPHDADLLAAALSSALMHERDPAVLEEAVPLYPIWSLGNLWHWMYDSAPKVLMMERAGYSGPYIVNKSSRVIVEGMELLGIEPERLLHCADPHLVRRVFLPKPVLVSELPTMQKLLLAVRETLLARTGSLEGGKRCYIKRIGTRRVANEEELFSLLAKYDIAILVPEEHSLGEQIRFMSNADLTLSPHGANSTLALFQKRKSVFMEFFGFDHIHNTCNMAFIRGLKLLYVPITETVLSKEPLRPGREKTDAGKDAAIAPDAGTLDDYYINATLVETVLENIHSVSYTF